MTNKTVIRKKNEVGKFTTIHHSILLDTRLSSTAFRLLTMILSDSDTEFNLSQTLYCNRLDVTKQTFFTAIDNLEENGYLRKTELDPENTKKSKKKLFSYTISEFGNLNTKEKKKEVTEKTIKKKESIHESTQIQTKIVEKTIVLNEVAQELPQPQLEIDEDLNAYLLSIAKLLDFDEVYNSIMAKINNNLSIEEIKKWVEKYLVLVFKEKLLSIENTKDHPNAFKEFKTWLKTEIFENFNLEADVESKWKSLRLFKYGKKFTTDYETKMGDYYESAKD
jgi:DNA-binding MarR family transcriptional regulator